nr:Chain B, PTSYAGDDSG [synthetic construct]
PTSYAGDDSG